MHAFSQICTLKNGSIRELTQWQAASSVLVAELLVCLSRLKHIHTDREIIGLCSSTLKGNGLICKHDGNETEIFFRTLDAQLKISELLLSNQ